MPLIFVGALGSLPVAFFEVSCKARVEGLLPNTRSSAQNGLPGQCCDRNTRLVAYKAFNILYRF